MCVHIGGCVSYDFIKNTFVNDATYWGNPYNNDVFECAK